MSNDPNRDLAEQRLNMEKDPGGYYADLNQKHENQQNNGGGGGGGGQCFTGDTKVLTAFGWKDICDFRRNDTVLSYSASKHLIIERKVLKVKKYVKPSQVWELKFSLSKEVVRTTSAHSFLTKRGWIKTNDLAVGDITSYLDSNGNIVEQQIVSVTATSDYSETFNLITYGDNNFIVSGAVAHNFTYFRRLRSFITNICNGYMFELLLTRNNIRKQSV